MQRRDVRLICYGNVGCESISFVSKAENDEHNAAAHSIFLHPCVVARNVIDLDKVVDLPLVLLIVFYYFCLFLRSVDPL